MAKKAKGSRAKTSSGGRRSAKGVKKQSRKEAEKVLRSGPVRKRPKDVTLPGMEDRKDRQLSELASGVADERHTQAESKMSEAGLLQAVQKRMKSLGMATFKDHGVQFVRVPGDEKLRVKVDKGSAGEEQGSDLAEPEGDVDAMDALDNDGSGDAPGYEHEGDEAPF